MTQQEQIEKIILEICRHEIGVFHNEISGTITSKLIVALKPYLLPNWIDVKEKPKENCQCWITNGKEMKLANWVNNNFSYVGLNYNITHWQPIYIPEPPNP